MMIIRLNYIVYTGLKDPPAALLNIGAAPTDTLVNDRPSDKPKGSDSWRDICRECGEGDYRRDRQSIHGSDDINEEGLTHDLPK
jgi:hypothetical protein